MLHDYLPRKLGMEKHCVSIALCTYNGAAFLQEQLESYARQTRLPDELIVVDDQSNDNTTQIVQAFAGNAPFPVRLIVNDTNLGLIRNFSKAIGLTSGDIVFTSDQDDVWLNNKVQKVLELFDACPDCGLIFSNATVVNASLEPLGFTLWQSVQFDTRFQNEFERDAFRTLLRRDIVTGSAAAFRGRFRDLILPVPHFAQWHDQWFSQILAAVSEAMPLDEPLHLYRQHESNLLGGNRMSWWDRLQRVRSVRRLRRIDLSHLENRLNQFFELRRRLTAPEAPLAKASALHALDGKIALSHARLRMHQDPWLKFPLLLRECLLFRYHRYALGFKTILMDVL